jgi:hypothetical protein
MENGNLFGAGGAQILNEQRCLIFRQVGARDATILSTYF